MSERYLIDKSALARWEQAVVADVLDPLHDRGLLCITGAVHIEVKYSARDGQESERLDGRLRGFDCLPCPDEVWDAAIETQDKAIAKGNHRALSLADLVIAATAQRHRVTVLHYDQDYDQIAELTGYPSRWVVEPGTADV
ncbi:PIN domain nuclease [Streptomyces sp. NBC_01142]|uniref:PIN domain nuclease n=1 Tax=Streptomyces sp. NBC_01142 TaxID=2975865 RepID=UPI002258081B|nr:PIN domain nuclease [Streptomyces sp. NBC_01142]MCX4824707.1 PIN domain nuclease [Streptomyces sp. NBC_01142]